MRIDVVKKIDSTIKKGSSVIAGYKIQSLMYQQHQQVYAAAMPEVQNAVSWLWQNGNPMSNEILVGYKPTPGIYYATGIIDISLSIQHVWLD